MASAAEQTAVATRIVRAWPAMGLLATAWLLQLLYAYPGFLSADSADQLDQARSWTLTDWHPPVMAVIWWLCECVVAGPLGMLLIQITGFIAGAYLILGTRLSSRAAASAVLVIAIFPPNLTVFGVIWKDCQMAAFALAGIACLLRTSRRARIAACVWFFLASAMRHNAAALTLPVLVLLWPASEDRRVLGVVRAVGVWAAITFAALGTNALLAHKREHPWVMSIATTDVVGTIAHAPPLDDAAVRRRLDGARINATGDLQAAFAASDHQRGWLYYYMGDAPPLAMPETDAERAAITRAWRELVVDEPVAYLAHRWEMFRRVLRIGTWSTPPIWTAFTYRAAPELAERLHHDASKSRLQRWWFKLVRLTPGFLFQPLLYLVAAAILVVLARRHRLALALACSGIAYQLPLFIVAPSDDYRYSHWLVLTTILAGVLVVAARRRARELSRRPGSAASDLPATDDADSAA